MIKSQRPVALENRNAETEHGIIFWVQASHSWENRRASSLTHETIDSDLAAFGDCGAWGVQRLVDCLRDFLVRRPQASLDPGPELDLRAGCVRRPT